MKAILIARVSTKECVYAKASQPTLFGLWRAGCRTGNEMLAIHYPAQMAQLERYCYSKEFSTSQAFGGIGINYNS